MIIQRATQMIPFGVFLTVIAIHSFVGATPATAATYYVAMNGSDSNSGTEAQPFRTIAKAVGSLKAGDTLYVRGGVYAESIYCNINVCIPSGASWSAPVTLAGYPGETVILRPDSGLRVLNFANNQSYIVIQGFIIDAGNVGYDAIQFEGTSNHISIKNSEIMNVKSQGINIATNASYIDVVSSTVHDVGLNNLTHGIYIAGSNNTVQKTTIYNAAGYGVHVYNEYAGKRADNNIIRSNRIYKVGLQHSSAAAILLGSGSNNIAYNNIIWSSPIGIKVAYLNAQNTKVFNNTVYGNSYGIHLATDSSNTLVKNNISNQNGSNILDQGQGTTLANNLTANPLFVDALSQNFKLQPASPAIDAGVTLPEVLDDHDGLPRPQGALYEIGAYESPSQSSAAVPKAPANLRIVP